MTSSAERSAPHPGSKLPPPLSPPHVGGWGVQRPLLYRHRYSSFGALSGASPLTRSRGFTPRDRLDDFKRRAERATSWIKAPPTPIPSPRRGRGSPETASVQASVLLVWRAQRSVSADPIARIHSARSARRLQAQT